MASKTDEFDEVVDKKPQFGNRHLTNKQDVFKHNAWDDVEWDDVLEKEAEQKVSDNSRVIVDDEMQVKYEEEANQFWDRFYEIHQNRFFKDRHWFCTEFPELRNGLENSEKKGSLDSDQTDPLFILEVGCGVGNTVFPILETSNNQRVFVYCCDFSKTALDVLKSNELYDPKRCHAFYCDLSKDKWETPFAECSLDIVILIFVLSAVHPDRMQRAVCNLTKYLKPGGVILLRDYGRYDMAQLRFKSGRCLADNFYVRGDGTRVFFFTQDEIRKLFTDAGLIEEQNLVDRRLQVNRGKQLTMYRVWIQAKYRKPLL